MSYDQVYAELVAGKAGNGLPCERVRALLGQLGFSVKDGGRGGHKVVTHDYLPEFFSAGYNCKGGNGIVDRNYVGALLRVLRTHRDGIRRHMGEDDSRK